MSARDQFVLAVQRCCGAACQLAMDQIPSVSDPELRAAFTSWARLGAADEVPASAVPDSPAAGTGGYRAAVEVTQ